MESRKKDGYQTYLHDFLKFDILVTCPNCSGKAIVKHGHFSFQKIDESDVKVVCTQCGYNKRLLEKPTSVLYSSSSGRIVKGRYYIMGGAIDPFFYLPLWLITDCEGHCLWAYNLEHLNFLREHVEAKLRERKGKDLMNKSMGSRLPKWMTAKKNRELVIRKISELQNK